jgi:hypothetical protein
MPDLAANLLALLHIGYFLFIVLGTVAILHPRRPWWVRSWTFRLTHLLAVYIVLAENVLNLPCPLNVAQWSLRSTGGRPQEAGEGVSGLLDWLLFHTIPGNLLNVMYVGLGILLPVLMIMVPPGRRIVAPNGEEV